MGFEKDKQSIIAASAKLKKTWFPMSEKMADKVIQLYYEAVRHLSTYAAIAGVIAGFFFAAYSGIKNFYLFFAGLLCLVLVIVYSMWRVAMIFTTEFENLRIGLDKKLKKMDEIREFEQKVLGSNASNFQSNVSGFFKSVEEFLNEFSKSPDQGPNFKRIFQSLTSLIVSGLILLSLSLLVPGRNVPSQSQHPSIGNHQSHHNSESAGVNQKIIPVYGK